MKPKTVKQEELLLTSPYNKKRFRCIQHVLMEAAVGNFSCRVERSGKDDPLEALAAMTNMVMEELEALFTRKGNWEAPVNLKTYLMEQHKDKIPELKAQKRVNLRNIDVCSIRNAHNHIRRHPEGPVASLKGLAHTFGINEYKLKQGFRQLYGISVFRYLREERLKRVKLLIQTTEMPLKDIARITGFKDASHFTKAFKKQYGCCPKTLKNLPLEDT